MATYDFQFCADSGRTTYICASSRMEAIKIFCEENGVNEDYVREHCIVRNKGRCD